MPTSGRFRIASNWRDAEHAQVADRERAAGQLLGGQRADRAAAARASLWTRMSVSPRVSAWCSTGTIRPSSSATAMPMLTSPWRTIASGSKTGVQSRMQPQSHGHGLGDEVAQRELDVLGGEPLVEVLADGDQLVDADVDVR